MEDLEAVTSLYENSSSLHLPWTFPPKDYPQYLNQQYRYFLCLNDISEIIGTFNISGLARGFFHSAYLGFEVFSPYEHQGLMRSGIKLLIEEAFGVLNLHRLEANIQPANVASIRLVSGAGFVKEGVSKNYLNVGGEGWKDHERWALINEDWRQEP